MPVLFFSPGLGMKPSDYTVLLKEMASHGYMVIAVAHTPVIAQDTNLNRIVLLLGDDLISALNHVTRAHEAGDVLFQRANPSLVGVFGHSIGGAAAAEAMARNGRFATGADLDGTVFGKAVLYGLKNPFLLLIGKLTWLETFPRRPPEFVVDHDRERMHEQMMFMRSPNMIWATVKGLRHMNFTDDAFMPGLNRIPEVLGLRTDGATTLKLTSWYLTRFFAGVSADELQRPPYTGIITRTR
jgi:hypothetical protein